jgi:HipA-like protein
MRQAHKFHKDQLAGILTENDEGYEFRYLPKYLSLETTKAVSLTLEKGYYGDWHIGRISQNFFLLYS